MKRSALILGSIFLVALIAGSLFFLIPKNYVVVYDGTSFSPSSLTIPHNSTVTFKNKSNEPFWPASDLHPSHMVYQTFDTQQPIPAGESWQHTFTESGTWGYHNHIRPTHTGRIAVLTEDGKVVSPEDCTAPSNLLRCTAHAVTEAFNRESVASAFAVLSSAYMQYPELREQCHDIAHFLGNATYEQFNNHTNPELPDTLSLCGYGFFHGFMESLISQSGDLEEARAFCAYVHDHFTPHHELSFNACYHGIGHGAVEGNTTRILEDPLQLIEPALRVCEEIAVNDNERYQCGNGIFDGLVTLYRENGSVPTVEIEEAYNLCLFVETHFKQSCYEQLNPIAGYLGKGNPHDTLAVALAVKEKAFLPYALRTAAGTLASADMSKEAYENIADACGTLEGELYDSCLFGFLAKLVEFGPMGEEELIGLQFCALPVFTEEKREHCEKMLKTLSTTKR